MKKIFSRFAVPPVAKSPRRWGAMAASAALLGISLGASLPVPAAAAPLRAERIPAPAFLHAARRLAPWPAAAAVRATIVLTPHHPAGLAAAALARSTPGNALYRHWESPQVLWSRYGPRASEVAAVTQELTRQGFRVHVGARPWTLQAAAPATRWESLLSTTLSRYEWHGHAFRGRATPETLPASLSGLVAGVTGLTNFAPPVGRPSSLFRAGTRPAALDSHPTATAAAVPASSTTRMTESSGGLTVTLEIPGGLSKPTGLPMHWVFQSSLDGSPDTAGGVSWKQGVGASDPQWGYGALNQLTGGYSVMRLVSQSPLVSSVQVTVYGALQSDGYPVPGTPSVTFSIPRIAWAGSATQQALSAHQIDGLYGAQSLLSSSAATPAVGLVEAEPPSSSIASALSAFSSANQLAEPTVTSVAVTTGTPPSSGWGQEEMLDLEAAAAAAPGSAITVYSDPQFDLGALFQMVAAAPKVSTLSLSFGSGGSDQSLAPLIEAVNAEGVTVIASAGDFGSLGSPSSTTPLPVEPPAVSHPANLPNVTAVGGTDVAVASGTSNAVATVAWGGLYLEKLPGEAQAEVLAARTATGGGYSTSEAAPPWQQPLLGGQTGRGVPDIGLLANPNVSGLALVGRSGQAEVGGGTSQGAPLLAGWVADIAAQQGQGLGNLNPLLYGLAGAAPASFTQAASGANGAYAIGASDSQPGTWNPLTGLGSPSMAAVAAAAASGLPPTAALSLPSGSTFGSGVTVTASSQRVASPTYQFWVQDPQNGTWTSSGGFSPDSAYAFTPPVPGKYAVVVFVRPAGGATVATARGHFAVAALSPMASGLTVTSSAGGGVEPAGASVTFTASAVDPGGSPRYQFWVRGPSGGWQVQQNYGPSGQFTLSNLKPGSYAISAYALDQAQLAQQAWGQAYNYATVVNVGSAVALQAPAAAAAGAPVTATAAATALTDPVYQFWVENPSGVWSQSGPYGPARTFQFTPVAAGTYRVVVYAKDPYAPNTAAFSVRAVSTVTVSG